jgi:hypothetical protein
MKKFSTTYTGISLPNPLREAIKRDAEINMRSISTTVVLILDAHYKVLGLSLPAPALLPIIRRIEKHG